MTVTNWWGKSIEPHTMKVQIIEEARGITTKCNICLNVIQRGTPARMYFSYDCDEEPVYAHESCIEAFQLCPDCRGKGYLTVPVTDPLYHLLGGLSIGSAILGTDGPNICERCARTGVIEKNEKMRLF